MLVIYRILINFIFFVSPIIIIFRLIKKKEDFYRFKEKFCRFTKNRKSGKIIWIHGASVGEFQSIVPLIEKYEKKADIAQILITSNTLSSSKVISKYRFKKVIHQFFPIDTNYHTKKFLEHWKPTISMFIDSEIWPNMLFNLNKKKIPIILINARLTHRSFKRWSRFKKFSMQVFRNFNLCICSNLKTKKYLKKLGVKNIKYFGNLKYSQSESQKFKIDNQTKKLIKNRTSWCASSTHNLEEEFIGQIHNKLKNRYKDLLTVIIPRHIDRKDFIKDQLSDMGLKVHLHEPKTKINKNTDVYLVNSFGQTKSFYSLIKNVFLGGSLIKHGGQNPLEAVRYNCNILHGPNVFNFKEIYKFLNKRKISKKIYNLNQASNILDKLLKTKTSNKNIKNKIKVIGNKILKKHIKEINLILKKI